LTQTDARVAPIDTVREASVGFSKQCHRRCLRFARNSATGTGNIYLINFVSDVRCKSLFYLHKPNLQPRCGGRLSVASSTADVLPFAYDRLLPETKSHVVQLSLLGFATGADFEIRVAGLVGAGPGKEALPTEPALAPIDPSMIQCFYGADEDDTACQFLQGKAEVIRTAGGHHFDRNYAALAQRILGGFRERAGL
jgi:hypothetical protein